MKIIQHLTKWGMGLAESPYWILNVVILILAILGCVLIMHWEIKLIKKLIKLNKEKKEQNV